MEATALRDRASALAGELAQLRDDAHRAGDVGLHQELKAPDRILHGSRGEATINSYHSLAASLREEGRPDAAAEYENQTQAFLEKRRREMLHDLTKSSKQEAEHQLAQRHEQVDKDTAALQSEALHLEAREATIGARESNWQRHRNRVFALGATIAVTADLLIRTLV